jgi:hypothetical protein
LQFIHVVEALALGYFMVATVVCTAYMVRRNNALMERMDSMSEAIRRCAYGAPVEKERVIITGTREEER